MHDYQTSASLTKIKSFNCLRLIKSMESVLLYFLILQNLLTCKDNSSWLQSWLFVGMLRLKKMIIRNIFCIQDKVLIYLHVRQNSLMCQNLILLSLFQHPPFLQASLMLILFAPFAPLTLTHKFYVTNSQVRNMSAVSVSRNIR